MKVTKMALPSVDEIQTEAQWIERLIKITTERINSSDCDLKQSLHLEFCRAEQQAYLAGLLYALGHPTILDRLEVVLQQVDLSKAAKTISEWCNDGYMDNTTAA